MGKRIRLPPTGSIGGERRPRRINGLSRPYSYPQIGAWIAYLVSIVQFVLFISPILPIVASIPVTIVFMIPCTFVLYYGIQTILINPIDIHFYQSLKEREQQQQQQQQQQSIPDDDDDNNDHEHNNNNNSSGKPKKTSRKVGIGRTNTTSSSTLEYKLNPLLLTKPVEDMKQCWLCDAQVATHSMHCKYCNKCVYHFDHHCLWLNTCIGKANYKQFFGTMVSLCSMELVHCIIQIALVVDIFTNGRTKERAENWIFVHNNSIVLVSILLAFVCFNILSMILLGQLIWLHTDLQQKHLTTYEYIVLDSKRKRELGKLKGDLERQRVTEIELSKHNHDTIRYYRLVCGGFCRNTMHIPQCDVLELPKPYEPDPNSGFGSVLGGGGGGGDTTTSVLPAVQVLPDPTTTNGKTHSSPNGTDDVLNNVNYVTTLNSATATTITNISASNNAVQDNRENVELSLTA